VPHYKTAANAGVMIFEVPMQCYLRSILIILLSSLALGCVPFPTKNIDTPKINGVLYSKGSVMSGYKVYLSYEVSDACSESNIDKSLSSETNSDGRFELLPTYKWSLVRWAVPLDGYADFNVCFVAPDGTKKWAYISHIRTPSWAPNLSLSCEMEDLLSVPLERNENKMFGFDKVCNQ
jgi:hypothetical protein